MGLNFYHRTNICEHCGRYDTRHIGKSSMGWQFGFRGYKPDEYDDDQTRIESYKDWLALLEAGGKIFDEYGKEISLDDFKAMVESKRSEKLNHTTYCRTHHPQHAREDCWLDPEGYDFDKGDFS